jgi:predicted amidohydrolase YtcJ
MLAVGRAADLTMYDRKLEASRQLLETKIVMTVVDGDVVFDATGAAE